MNNETIYERLLALEKKINPLSKLIDQQTQRAPHYLNYCRGHYFKPHNIMLSYYHLGWSTYEDFYFGSQNFQSLGGSGYNYHEQIQQPCNEEKFYVLLNEMKKDNAAWDAKMKDKVTNEEALVKNLENQIGQLAHTLEELYSRPLTSDIKDEDIGERNFVPLSFEEEIQDPTLVEEKRMNLLIRKSY